MAGGHRVAERPARAGDVRGIGVEVVAPKVQGGVSGDERNRAGEVGPPRPRDQELVVAVSVEVARGGHGARDVGLALRDDETRAHVVGRVFARPKTARCLHAVAVGVGAVLAHVHRARRDGGVEVVAVAANRGVPGRWRAHEVRRGVVAVAVGVAVEVPGHGGGVVHGAVAVVIDAVARLLGGGAHRRVGVVAVSADRREAARRVARDHGLARAGAVPVGIGVPFGVDDVIGFVRRPVAIVVAFVAALGGVRAERGVGVVAIAGHLGGAVAIVVGEVGEARVIAGLVDEARG